MSADPLLNDQLNLLDLLFDRMPMGIVVFDRRLRIRRFNPTWAQFIDRYTQAAAADVTPGIHFFDLLPDIKERFDPLLQRVLSGETVQVDALPSTSGGITSYWDVVFSPLTHNGEVVGVLDVVIDATERQQILAELQQNEAHLHSMLESARGYAIYRIAVDPDDSYYGEVELFSPSIRDVVGIDNPEDFASWFTDIHPADRPRVTAANERAMLEGIPFDETMRLWHRKREDWRWVHTVSNPVFDKTGRVTHFNGITMDVTEQKEAEEALAAVNVMLEQKVSERTQELSTLLAASQNVASTLELEPLLGQVLDQLKSVVPFDGASILQLAGDDLLLLAYRGPIPETKVARLRFPLQNAGVNQAVIHRLAPVIVPDVYAESPLARAFRDTAAEELHTTFGYVRSWMGVPLIVRGELLGMLSLDHGETDFYNEELAELVQAFANQVSVFIDNGRLFTETRRTADELRTLLNVQQAINSRLDTDIVLQMIADEACRLTETKMAAVYLLDGEELEIRVVSGGVDPAFAGYRLPVEGSIAGLVIAEKRPHIVPDTTADPRVYRELIEAIGAESFVIVPLLSGENPIGTITVANKQTGTLGADDERILTMMASGAVIALENARSYEAEQSRRYEAERRRLVAEGLRDILGVLNSTQPLPQVLDYIVRQASDLMGPATAVAIFHFGHEHQRAVLEAHYHLEPGLADIQILPGTITGMENFTAYEPVVVPDVTKHVARMQSVAADDSAEAETALKLLQNSYRSYLAVPLVIRDELYGGMAFHYKQQRNFSEEDINLALALGDQAALAIENARLYEKEQERREVAESLRDILRVLNSNQPLPQVMDVIAEQACGLLDADSTMIRRINYQQDTVETVAAYQLPADFDVIREIPFYRTGSETPLMDNQPIAVTDLRRSISRQLAEGRGAIPDQQRWMELLLTYYRSHLVVPLFVRDALYGTITFYYAQPRAFSEEDLRIGTTLGGQVSLAIENARLRDDAEQIAVLAERNRLARELHDAVTQTLFSASLIADVLPRIWERDQKTGRQRLEELRELTRGALAEMRTLLLELRPATLTESSLSELLQQLTTAVIGRSRLPVELHIDDERQLPPEVQVVLYRIAQEALNNVAKHAGAESVTISLQFDEKSVTLEIVDDGRGFDIADTDPQSMGLSIMRERIEKIDASLQIESTIGVGTAVRVCVIGV